MRISVSSWATQSSDTSLAVTRQKTERTWGTRPGFVLTWGYVPGIRLTFTRRIPGLKIETWGTQAGCRR
jgi:hypothetical protein